MITVPSGAPAGPYAVTAQCPAQPGGAPTSISVNVVSLTLSPSSGTPGTTVSVTGDGYTQCDQVQLQLLRDTTQDVATSSPIGPASGVFTAEVTVPSGATPGADYQVDAECYPVAAGSAAIAIEPFTVTTPVAPTSPASSSTSASPGSPSSSPTGPTPSPSSSGSPSVITGTSTQSPGRTGGLWVPVALAGGTGAGLILAGLLLVRALSMLHGQRGRSWVNKHLRVVAGTAGTVSADVEDRPGAASVSVGLEPHLDDLGNQRYEEVAR